MIQNRSTLNFHQACIKWRNQHRFSLFCPTPNPWSLFFFSSASILASVWGWVRERGQRLQSPVRDAFPRLRAMIALLLPDTTPCCLSHLLWSCCGFVSKLRQKASTHHLAIPLLPDREPHCLSHGGQSPLVLLWGLFSNSDVGSLCCENVVHLFLDPDVSMLWDVLENRWEPQGRDPLRHTGFKHVQCAQCAEHGLHTSRWVQA